MKKLILLLILNSIILSACNSHDSVKWYNTKNEAIEAGIKEEEIIEGDIIDELVVDDETFFVFLSGSKTIAVANLAKKNHMYTWYRSSAFTYLNKVSLVSWEFESEAKDTYIIYAGAGIPHDQSISINTVEGVNTPIMNEEAGIFYYIAKK